MPPALSALVMGALEKDPARRPQSAGELLAALESLGHQPVAAHASPAATTSTSRTKTAVRASVAALAAVAVIALIWIIRRGTPIAAALERSVIVLPFENSSRDTTQEHYADGLTDELIGRLAAAGLRVTGRNTAFGYTGKHPTAREAGKRGGVATVLSGQVKRLMRRCPHRRTITCSAPGSSATSLRRPDRRRPLRCTTVRWRLPRATSMRISARCAC